MKKKHKKTPFVPDSAYRKNPYTKDSLKKNGVIKFIQNINFIVSFFMKNLAYKTKKITIGIKTKRNENKRIKAEIKRERKEALKLIKEKRKLEKDYNAENKMVNAEIAMKKRENTKPKNKKQNELTPRFPRIKYAEKKTSDINISDVFTNALKTFFKILAKSYVVFIAIAVLFCIFFFAKSQASKPKYKTKSELGEETKDKIESQLTFETDPVKSKEAMEFYAMLAENAAIDEYGMSIPLEYDDYVITEGDNATFISQKTGASIDTIISVNKLTNAHFIRPDKILKIPNRDGLLYTVKDNEDIAEIAERYEIPLARVFKVNKIEDSKPITNGEEIFLPGAKYTLEEKIKMYGLSFLTPLTIYRLTSMYGYRNDPFNKSKAMHKGIDMAAPTGTPVSAAKGGNVSFAGYSEGYGLLIIISHPAGYKTYYGHLSKIHVKEGQKIAMGQHIGNVGATGRVTGPHLHFEIRIDGTPVNPSRHVQLKK